jgi:hypothetical protein
MTHDNSIKAAATRLGPPPQRVLSVQANPHAGGGQVERVDTHLGLLCCEVQR